MFPLVAALSHVIPLSSSPALSLITLADPRLCLSPALPVLALASPSPALLLITSPSRPSFFSSLSLLLNVLVSLVAITPSLPHIPASISPTYHPPSSPNTTLILLHKTPSRGGTKGDGPRLARSFSSHAIPLVTRYSPCHALFPSLHALFLSRHVLFPLVMRSSPLVMRSSPLVMRSSPLVMRSSPLVMRSSPLIMCSSTLVMRSPPLVLHSSPLVMCSPPSGHALSLFL
ncbi:unnamed protein product [Closterium sp. NIES-54]